MAIGHPTRVLGVAVALALIGWAAGSLKGGLILGAVLGVPLGIAGVWRRYRSYFS